MDSDWEIFPCSVVTLSLENEYAKVLVHRLDSVGGLKLLLENEDDGQDIDPEGF